MSLFFDLFRCQDKHLRQYLKQHIINDIKNINSKNKNIKVNTVCTSLQVSYLSNEIFFLILDFTKFYVFHV